MSASLDHVSDSLEILKSVDSKLDTLNGVSVNQKLSGMARDSKTADSSLNGMRVTLVSMQRDIQTMSQKISGSFLFRSVKSH